MSVRLRFAAAIGCLVLALAVPFSSAQDAPAADNSAPVPNAAAPAGPALDDEQEAIRVRYDRFEDTLLKMARYLQKTEPARAELVLRALGRSQEEQVADRMERIAGMLTKGDGNAPRYADAIEEQEAILANLRELLTILRSEDILDENRKEQERLKELARQVAALIDAEKIHQADTQRGEPTDRVAEAQGRTAKRTGDVVRKIDEHDRAAAEESEGSGAEGEESEGEQNGESGEKGEGQKGQQGQSGEGQKGQSG
ncbi:MAG TPA: hypothetical protein VF170_14965, partial [Planctomycetaceae bacterium]